MKLNKEQKKEEVKRLTEQIKRAKSVIVLGFKGTKVAALTNLRKKLKEKEINIKVVKNSLLQRAMQAHGYQLSDKVLSVPLAVVIGLKDEIEPAKLLEEERKKITTLQPLSGVFEGKLVDDKYISELAKLPSREELLAKLVATIKAPMSGLQNALRYNLSALTNLLKQRGYC